MSSGLPSAFSKQVTLFGLSLFPSHLGSTGHKHALESYLCHYSVCLGNLFYLCKFQFTPVSYVISSKTAYTFQYSCEDQIS